MSTATARAGSATSASSESLIGGTAETTCVELRVLQIDCVGADADAGTSHRCSVKVYTFAKSNDVYGVVVDENRQSLDKLCVFRLKLIIEVAQE